MKKLILLIFVCSLSFSSSFLTFDSNLMANISILYTDPSWQEYSSTNDLNFNSLLKEVKSYDVFKTNLATIESHNSNTSTTWKMGQNPFIHLDFSDFTITHLGTKLPETKKQIFNNIFDLQSGIQGGPPTSGRFGSYNLNNIPASLSYLNLMQPIQDQGTCACCWAFAALSQIGLNLQQQKIHKVLKTHLL